MSIQTEVLTQRQEWINKMTCEECGGRLKRTKLNRRLFCKNCFEYKEEKENGGQEKDRFPSRL